MTMRRDKSEREMQADLLLSAALAVKAYEDYLLDRIGWLELARIMTALRKNVVAVDPKLVDDSNKLKQ
jgi:hypothetical protein